MALAVIEFDTVCCCVLTGEGYECSVTVDDEDSKVIIFDNWKQVSQWMLSSDLVKLARELLAGV